MKMYWPVLPVKVAMSRFICSACRGAELADDVEMLVAKLAVGLTVHVTDERLHSLRQRDVCLASIEHRDLVASSDIQFDARQRNLSGAADVENAECHGSSAPSVVRRPT